MLPLAALLARRLKSPSVNSRYGLTKRVVNEALTSGNIEKTTNPAIVMLGGLWICRPVSRMITRNGTKMLMIGVVV